MKKIHRGKITRGKSSLRKVANSLREAIVGEDDVLAMIIVHPRSGDRNVRSLSKVLVHKIANT